MVKKILSVVVILLAGGAWLYLDCLSKHEQGSARQTRVEIEKARSEAQKRALYKVNFESQLLTDLNICQATADKGKKDFMSLIPKAVVSKRGPYVIPQAIEAEASKILEEAKMECQQLYDVRIKAGQ